MEKVEDIVINNQANIVMENQAKTVLDSAVNNVCIKAEVSYLGDGLKGFQIQPGLNTVQGNIEGALARIFGQRIVITPSGRTDEGVHALSQTVSFTVPRRITETRLKAAINHYMPENVRIINVAEVAPDFNARIFAHRKTYEYLFYVSDIVNPFYLNRAFNIKHADLTLMQSAAALFEGKHDFKNFYCVGSSAKTTVRQVFSCQVSKSQITEPSFAAAQLITLRITGGGFLYKMVRLIAGSVLAVGQGRKSLDDLQLLINGTAKTVSKIALPSYALYLIGAQY